MCGIAGFVGPGTRPDLEQMCEALVHRGPDDSGEWFSDGGAQPLAFGFRRLSILDPVGGAQPMLDTDSGNAVVFNGEIYNHMELRQELAALGASFQSDHSDTEVLLHAYAQWGEDMVTRLNGMFAFALYDKSRDQVFLARDRFAKKPLYFLSQGGAFIFASELTALAKHPAVSANIDPQSLMQFFGYGYVPAPATLYQGVQKLPGGVSAVFNIGTGALRLRTFWRYEFRDIAAPSGGPKAWASDVLNLLRKAVGRRLESDVPLGFFLSGGMDSASVVALARDILGVGAPLDTFTIGFQESSYDESAQAAEVAAHFGTRHHEQILDLDGSMEVVDEILGAVDEPVADPSILPTYLLSKFAKESVTVALSGDGGDELFAGYDTFGVLNQAKAYHGIVPSPLHTVIRRAADLLPRSKRNLSFDFKLRRALRGLSHDPAAWHPVWLAPADVGEISELFRNDVTVNDLYGAAIDLWEGSQRQDVHDRALEFYANFYLPGSVLAKVDRASMLNSLEVRSPFLDRDLADYCLGLPYDAKHRDGQQKWILAKAMDGIVPPSVLARKKKGFGIPVAEWLRKWPVPDRGRTADMGMDFDFLGKKWKDHANGSADNRGILFAWVCLDRWLENHPKL